MAVCPRREGQEWLCLGEINMYCVLGGNGGIPSQFQVEIVVGCLGWVRFDNRGLFGEGRDVKDFRGGLMEVGARGSSPSCQQKNNNPEKMIWGETGHAPLLSAQVVLWPADWILVGSEG